MDKIAIKTQIGENIIIKNNEKIISNVRFKYLFTSIIIDII